MQKRAADTSGSLCVACSTDLQERVIFLWGPLKFSIFGESGGTSRPMTRASFFATLLPNARIPLNKRICKREPSFQVGSLSCIRSIQSSRYIPPISFQIFFFQCSLALLAWGRNSCVRFAFFSMSRLPKHSCAVTAQHLPCRCFSLFIAPE